MPNKPTGKVGAFSIGPKGVNMEDIDFPTNKEDIERYVAQQFVTHPPRDETEFFLAETLQQNLQDDLDFSVDTENGNKYLELMEFAPLGQLRGVHDQVPTQHDVGGIVDFFLGEVEKKSLKYSNVPDVFLVTYVTERALNLMPYLRVIKSQLNQSQLSLERVYYVSLHGTMGASSFRLYPLEGAVLSKAEEARWRNMTAYTPRHSDMGVGENSVEIPIPRNLTKSDGDN